MATQAENPIIIPMSESIERIIAYIHSKLGKSTTPFMLLIGAGSSAGKGLVIERIHEEFASDIAYLPLDDYYHGQPFMSSAIQAGKSYLNWDHPGAVDLDMAYQHVCELLQGRAVEKPRYSFKSGQRIGTETVDAKRIILVEGNFALHHPGLRDLAMLRIFVDAKRHSRLFRRLLRDVKRTAMTPEEILSYFIATVEPMHDQFVLPSRAYAQLVIENEYVAELESLRADMFHEQFKFRGKISAESLRKAGASHLASIDEQLDTYYTASDYDVLRTDEIVRIRREGRHSKFSMKGPKHHDDLYRRAKFEFLIDGSLEQPFAGFYGKELLRVRKERHLHVLDGVIIASDFGVTREAGHHTMPLGDFVEVSATHPGIFDQGKLEAVAAKLGLSPHDAISKAYMDI